MKYLVILLIIFPFIANAQNSNLGQFSFDLKITECTKMGGFFYCDKDHVNLKNKKFKISEVYRDQQTKYYTYKTDFGREVFEAVLKFDSQDRVKSFDYYVSNYDANYLLSDLGTKCGNSFNTDDLSFLKNGIRTVCLNHDGMRIELVVRKI